MILCVTKYITENVSIASIFLFLVIMISDKTSF